MSFEKKNIFIIANKPEEISEILLPLNFNIDIAGDEKTAKEAIISGKKYDLFIIDSTNQTVDNGKIYKLIRNSEINRISPVIFLTSVNNSLKVSINFQYCADDFIIKPFKKEELLIRVENLLNKTPFKWKKYLITPFKYENNENLTSRQFEILQLTSQGYSNKEIATLLYVSEKTVKAHLRVIFDKLHVSNRVQATLVAIKEGIAS